MVTFETIQSLNTAGWQVQEYQQPVNVQNFREEQAQTVEQATSRYWNYYASAALVGGLSVAFAPLGLVVAGGLALYGDANRRATNRIESAALRSIKASEDLYYLQALEKEIQKQQSFCTNPKDKTYTIKKVFSIWEKLSTFITELENTRNQAHIANFLTHQSAIMALKSAKPTKAKIMMQLNKCIGQDGIITKLISERKLLMGHLHNELVDNIEVFR